jgi:hypothetical protein
LDKVRDVEPAVRMLGAEDHHVHEQADDEHAGK